MEINKRDKISFLLKPILEYLIILLRHVPFFFYKKTLGFFLNFRLNNFFCLFPYILLEFCSFLRLSDVHSLPLPMSVDPPPEHMVISSLINHLSLCVLLKILGPY